MLNPGESTDVKGSGAKPYVIKNVDGMIWSCTCPAWKNSGGALNKKSCKHIRKVHGEAAELARIGGTASPSPSPSPSPRVAAAQAAPVAAQPHGGMHDGRVITADAEYAQSVIDRAAAEGRDLRQDEKAKLFGPPVLLANSFEDFPDMDPVGWLYSEKLDGVRAYWDGRNFISRQGNIYNAPDWFKVGLPTTTLDGELWIGRKMFQKTISVVRSDDWGAGAKLVKYVIYDAPSRNETFELRLKYIEELCDSMNQLRFIAHGHSPVRSRAQLDADLKQVSAAGAEGLMLRKPGSLYEACRSNTLLKVKLFQDTEGLVIGHKPGKKKHTGVMGALVIRMPSGVEFDLGTGFSDADRKNPPKIGESVTFRFTELTDDGKPKCTSFIAVRNYE